jgi:hypothetical protein
MSHSSRPPVTGRDVAGAGALLLAVNPLRTAVGAGFGALPQAVVPLALGGLPFGFPMGIWVVAKRFHDV